MAPPQGGAFDFPSNFPSCLDGLLEGEFRFSDLRLSRVSRRLPHFLLCL